MGYDKPMLCHIVSLSALCLIFCPLYSMISPVALEPSHSIMVGKATQVIMSYYGIPQDVTNLTVQFNWQLKLQEHKEWQPQLCRLNKVLKMNRCNTSDITVFDVISLTKEEKVDLQDIYNATNWHLDSYWDEAKIAALPLFLKNKFGDLSFKKTL